MFFPIAGPDGTDCERDRQRAMARGGTAYVPQCLDGRFALLQCSAVYNKCWCVDVNGNVLAGTKVTGSTRTCPPKGK